MSTAVGAAPASVPSTAAAYASDGPRALEPRYYNDPAHFDSEMTHLFAKSWHMVGHVTQLAEPGRVVTAVAGTEPVFVVNDSGTLRGFFNVCQHRGHELFPPQRPGGDTLDTPGLITCPYHAWVYGLDGGLLSARSRDVGEICLPAVQVETLAGFVFVNVDAKAQPLAAYAPGLADDITEVVPDAESRLLTWRRTHLINANWKLVVENYNECYHCPNVHRSLTSTVFEPGSYQIAPNGYVLRHTASAVSAECSSYERPDDNKGYFSNFIWPASAIQCYPGRLLNTYRWLPLAHDKTLLVREWWFNNAEPTPAQIEIFEYDWKTTVSEDLGLVESTQRGIRSRGYRPGPLIVGDDSFSTIHNEHALVHLSGLLHGALGQ